MATRTLEQAVLLFYEGAVRLSDHRLQRSGRQFIALADAEATILSKGAKVHQQHILRDKSTSCEIAIRKADKEDIRVAVVFNNLRVSEATELVIVDAIVPQR
jgi:hypothetical protein